jgi:hypothetical protein
MVRRPFTLKQFLSTVGVQEVMMDGVESSTEFKKKILEEVKRLTNQGRHVESSKLFNQYFGDNNGKN